MIRILLVSDQQDNFSDLASALKKDDAIEITHVPEAEKALAMAREVPFDLVVADQAVGNISGLGFIEKLVKVNPMLNTAAVSPLSREDFHEASEGLGVLTRLPVHPGESDARELMEKLATVMDLTGKRGA